MASQYQSVVLRPGQGGDLMTKPSAENVGLENYRVKRDWRRMPDQEYQREGDILFTPSAAGAHQPYPNFPLTNEAITLEHQVRAPNGKTALIVGTPTKLFAFFMEPGGVYDDDVFEDGVYSEAGEGEWVLIGSGFSPLGHRWEAVNVGGVAYFNNGVDLVQRYTVGSFEVTPLYEMREQGISCVETIAEFFGCLYVGDITEIRSDMLDGVLSGPDPYGPISDLGKVNRFAYRVVWSSIGMPDRWGASTTCNCSAGETGIQILTPLASIEAGDQILIVGAGENGANHTAKISYIVGSTAYLDVAPVTTVAGADLFKADQLSLTTGYKDLADDSSSVIRMMALQNRLVVLKDTGYFIGSFTGDAVNPFEFVRTYTGQQTIFWRWTLCCPDGQYLLFAGKFGFLTFSLTTQVPEDHKKLMLADDVFYDNVTPADENLVFAADNGMLSEIWFCFPGSGEDHALIWNYQFEKVETSSRHYTAAASIKKPGKGAQLGPQEDWFIAGTETGVVLQYAMNESGSLGFTTVAGSYEAVLEHGRGALGDEGNEKHVRRYEPLIASGSPDTEVVVSLLSSSSPSDQNPDTEVFETLQAADIEGGIELYARGRYFQDRIAVTGGEGVRLSGRLFEIRTTGDRATRTNAE